MNHLIRFLLLVPLVGCGAQGPTPAERYNTALEVLERETKTLVALERELKAAKDEVYERIKSEFLGDLPRRVDAAQQTVEQTQRIVESGERAIGQPIEGAREKLLEIAKGYQSLAQQELDRLDEFTAAIDDPDSETSRRITAAYEALPEREKHRRQVERVERAQRMVDEAESQLK